ncbi:MAG: UDP-3-O-(3-hydroxymyristoyl)glucosamine N-acyltransferase [Pseudomonadota bacterium]|nr:UDP-3-O-(3-hydroxymyristoyl)glucosamine N-acyltransferase [Pseudomonadota bacterium]
MSAVQGHSLHALAKQLGLTLNGAPDLTITGLATLESAGPSHISFYSNRRFHQALTRTCAGAVILRAEDVDECPVPALISDNPYASYARLSQLFAPPPAGEPGIHPSAVVDPTARIAADASIGPHAVIGAGTVVEARARVGANCVVGRNCHLGVDARLMPNVTLYDDVRFGERVLVHAGAVIGADGFGFASDAEGHHKIAQLGGVSIGDDVEIGAGTTIDRGALDDTVIGAGVKIDNQVQIAHNVRVGANTIICGCSAIAGSSVIGKNCIIAGAVGVINHVSICDRVTVTAMSLVNQSITEPGVYSSGTGLSDTASWRKNIVRFRQLDSISKRLQSLESAQKNSNE